jgi:hypothetical protein
MLVTHLIEQAQQKEADYLIIEVIEDNVPAHNLFKKNGFKYTRDLLVLRRPPGPPSVPAPPAKIKALGYKDAVELLSQRTSIPSWIDEKESLLNAGKLEAFCATLADGSEGWLVYQNTVFQLGRLVVETTKGDPKNVAHALLHHLHTEHAAQDTKTENLPVDDPHWPAFKKMGYITVFLRNEMILQFR